VGPDGYGVWAACLSEKPALTISAAGRLTSCPAGGVTAASKRGYDRRADGRCRCDQGQVSTGFPAEPCGVPSRTAVSTRTLLLLFTGVPVSMDS
jgi:hypothetical protein